MTDPITIWHADHVNFSRLLGLFEKQIGTFHKGGRPNYDLMRDIVYYLRHFPDRFHHPREDLAFERLAKYEPGLRMVTQRLEQEHRVIAAAGDELLQRLDEAAEGAVIPRESVETAASTYLVYYRHHIASEEKEIMPRAALLLTPHDWHAVAAAAPEGRDPVFGDDADERYRELRKLIAMEAKSL